MTVVSLDMAYCSFREVLAGLDTRLDTPPSIDSHHPDSGLALWCRPIAQAQVFPTTACAKDALAPVAVALWRSSLPACHQSGRRPNRIQAAQNQEVPGRR